MSDPSKSSGHHFLQPPPGSIGGAAGVGASVTISTHNTSPQNAQSQSPKVSGAGGGGGTNVARSPTATPTKPNSFGGANSPVITPKGSGVSVGSNLYSTAGGAGASSAAAAPPASLISLMRSQSQQPHNARAPSPALPSASAVSSTPYTPAHPLPPPPARTDHSHHSGTASASASASLPDRSSVVLSSMPPPSPAPSPYGGLMSHSSVMMTPQLLAGNSHASILSHSAAGGGAGGVAHTPSSTVTASAVAAADALLTMSPLIDSANASRQATERHGLDGLGKLQMSPPLRSSAGTGAGHNSHSHQSIGLGTTPMLSPAAYPMGSPPTMAQSFPGSYPPATSLGLPGKSQTTSHSQSLRMRGSLRASPPLPSSFGGRSPRLSPPMPSLGSFNGLLNITPNFTSLPSPTLQAMNDKRMSGGPGSLPPPMTTSHSKVFLMPASPRLSGAASAAGANSSAAAPTSAGALSGLGMGGLPNSSPPAHFRSVNGGGIIGSLHGSSSIASTTHRETTITLQPLNSSSHAILTSSGVVNGLSGLDSIDALNHHISAGGSGGGHSASADDQSRSSVPGAAGGVNPIIHTSSMAAAANLANLSILGKMRELHADDDGSGTAAPSGAGSSGGMESPTLSSRKSLRIGVTSDDPNNKRKRRDSLSSSSNVQNSSSGGIEHKFKPFGHSSMAMMAPAFTPPIHPVPSGTSHIPIMSTTALLQAAAADTKGGARSTSSNKVTKRSDGASASSTAANLQQLQQSGAGGKHRPSPSLPSSSFSPAPSFYGASSSSSSSSSSGSGQTPQPSTFSLGTGSAIPPVNMEKSITPEKSKAAKAARAEERARKEADKVNRAAEKADRAAEKAERDAERAANRAAGGGGGGGGGGSASSSAAGGEESSGIGSSCHQCKSRRSFDYLIYCANANPGKNNKPEKRCRKKYCEQCLMKFYNEHPPSKKETETWQCPACRGLCCCAACRRNKAKHQLDGAVELAPTVLLASALVYCRDFLETEMRAVLGSKGRIKVDGDLAALAAVASSATGGNSGALRPPPVQRLSDGVRANLLVNAAGGTNNKPPTMMPPHLHHHLMLHSMPHLHNTPAAAAAAAAAALANPTGGGGGNPQPSADLLSLPMLPLPNDLPALPPLMPAGSPTLSPRPGLAAAAGAAGGGGGAGANALPSGSPLMPLASPGMMNMPLASPLGGSVILPNSSPTFLLNGSMLASPFAGFNPNTPQTGAPAAPGTGATPAAAGADTGTSAGASTVSSAASTASLSSAASNASSVLKMPPISVSTSAVPSTATSITLSAQQPGTPVTPATTANRPINPNNAFGSIFGQLSTGSSSSSSTTSIVKSEPAAAAASATAPVSASAAPAAVPTAVKSESTLAASATS